MHGAEQLSYVAIARGRYTLSNGKVVLAASTTCDRRVAFRPRPLVSRLPRCRSSLPRW